MSSDLHEVGHAQQVAEGSALMRLRSLLVPVVTVGPLLGFLILFGGFASQSSGLFIVAILAFAVTVLFSLLTLPVEIQASQKALAMLESTGVIATAQDRQGAQSMLRAAALTYVAGAVGSILTLLYYVTIGRRSS